MSADEAGNDLSAVGVPITGKIAYAPAASGNVISSEDGGNPNLDLTSLYPAYQVLGLIKQDGGFEDTAEAGDPIEFFQQGYKLSGEDSLRKTVGLAENSPVVRKFVHGQEPDENGMYRISQAVPDNEFLIFTETVYKNKTREREHGVARIQTLTRDKSERGSVQGWIAVLEYIPSELLDLDAFVRWYIPAPAGPTPPPTPTPVIESVAPETEAAADAEVTITGTGFTGATQVRFGSANAVFTVESDTEIIATMPAGSPGTANLRVSVGDVQSDSFPYARASE